MTSVMDDTPDEPDLSSLEQALIETNETLKGTYREMLAARDQFDAFHLFAAQVAAERQTIAKQVDVILTHLGLAAMEPINVAAMAHVRQASASAKIIHDMLKALT